MPAPQRAPVSHAVAPSGRQPHAGAASVRARRRPRPGLMQTWQCMRSHGVGAIAQLLLASWAKHALGAGCSSASLPSYNLSTSLASRARPQCRVHDSAPARRAALHTLHQWSVCRHSGPAPCPSEQVLPGLQRSLQAAPGAIQQSPQRRRRQPSRSQLSSRAPACAREPAPRQAEQPRLVQQRQAVVAQVRLAGVHKGGRQQAPELQVLPRAPGAVRPAEASLCACCCRSLSAGGARQGVRRWCATESQPVLHDRESASGAQCIPTKMLSCEETASRTSRTFLGCRHAISTDWRVQSAGGWRKSSTLTAARRRTSALTLCHSKSRAGSAKRAAA